MEDAVDDSDPYRGQKPTRIRIKTSSRSKRSRDEDDGSKTKHHSSKRRRSKERHKSRNSRDHLKRKRGHESSKSVYDHTFARTGDYDDPDHRYRESLYDGLDGDGLASSHDPDVDPDQAFRESLFDALADDEGAAYWEGVYGQPVHVYPNAKQGGDGKLERMTDEEYAEYVRVKMWEKSHQHIIEERAARERERKKRKENSDRVAEEVDKEEAEREKVRIRMQESLQKGEERRRAREAGVAWESYVKKWQDLKKSKDLAQESELDVRKTIPWPVVSGKYRHVSREEIEYFLKHSSSWKNDATSLLKIERVRWHPDKVQQRFGGHVDPETMKSVTAVFQIVDEMWNDRKG